MGEVMKRIIVLVLCLLLACSCFSIVGCKHNCDKDGHVWKVETVLFESSCMEQGSAIYYCEECSTTKTDALALSEHSFDSAWSSDKNYHFHLCTYCESARKDEEAHTQDSIACSVCGRFSSVESLVIYPNNSLTACDVYRAGDGFNEEVLEIPSTFLNLPVETIISSAFYSNQTIKQLILSDSIKSIGDFSFFGCTELKLIDNSINLTKIGNNAFTNCYSLESISFSDKVTFVGKYAFQNCSSLTSITFARTSGWAFYDGDEKVLDVDFSEYTKAEIVDMIVNEYNSYTLEIR